MTHHATTRAQQQITPATPAPSGILQRKCACGTHTVAGGDCESCGKEKVAGNLQRAATNSESVNAAPPIVHEVLRSSGQPLDANTRSFFEPRFGHDFSRVRVHTDVKAAESARAVNALAYTVGQDLVFGVGKYAPSTTTGRQLLAHELTHVVQQSKSGATISSKLGVGSSHDSSEREADTVAARVVAGETISPASLMPAQHLQRDIVHENAAGCGICEKAEDAGKNAHTLAQAAFGIYPSVDTEQLIFYPLDKENGRLDLVRITKSPTPPFELYIEIGEIKPNNVDGNKRGHEDLAFYKGMMEMTKLIAGVSIAEAEISFMKLPAPKLPIAFKDPTSKCSGQALFIEGPFNGLYVYSCQPPRSSYPKQQCCQQGEKEPVRQPSLAPRGEKKKKDDKVTQPVTQPELSPTFPRQPALNVDQQIIEFIQWVIESGVEVQKAVKEFLKQHPEVAYFLYAAAAAIFIANIVEDIVTLGTGLADEPAVIAICWELIEEANAIRAAAPIPIAR